MHLAKEIIDKNLKNKADVILADLYVHLKDSVLQETSLGRDYYHYINTRWYEGTGRPTQFSKLTRFETKYVYKSIKRDIKKKNYCELSFDNFVSTIQRYTDNGRIIKDLQLSCKDTKSLKFYMNPLEPEFYVIKKPRFNVADMEFKYRVIKISAIEDIDPLHAAIMTETDVSYQGINGFLFEAY